MEFIKSGRLPIEARSSVENASKFLSWVESEFTSTEVINPDVYALASWANYPLFNDTLLAADHLVVESVENIGLESHKSGFVTLLVTLQIYPQISMWKLSKTFI